MRIVHVQSDCAPAPKRKSKKDMIREAAVEMLAIQRAIDRSKAKEKFAKELQHLQNLETELNNLIVVNHLQHYEFKNT